MLAQFCHRCDRIEEVTSTYPQCSSCASDLVFVLSVDEWTPMTETRLPPEALLLSTREAERIFS